MTNWKEFETTNELFIMSVLDDQIKQFFLHTEKKKSTTFQATSLGLIWTSFRDGITLNGSCDGRGMEILWATGA